MSRPLPRCDPRPANAPQGILNAHVSPDGKHIAYTIQQLFETFDCKSASAYRTSVVNIDGSNPVAIDDGSGDSTAAESLEMGSWVDNSSLLVDRASFGSVQVYRATLPSSSAAAWFGPSWTDFDAPYEHRPRPARLPAGAQCPLPGGQRRAPRVFAAVRDDHGHRSG